MRTLLSSLIVAVVGIGCATTDPTPQETGTQTSGRAELHVDAHAIFGITRVTVVSGDVTKDLTLNSSTGTFDGALLLAPGSQSLVASAFVGTVLVGQSNPTPVTVQVGVVTRVLLHIIDLSGDPPQTFGPIFDSISFPTTTEIGQPATLTLSVIAPAGDPVTYQWSSDCADAVLSVPTAATTQFTKPSAGACTISVTATSNGYSIGQSFVIAVFPSGATTGAAQINADVVSAPTLVLGLQDLGCNTFTDPMPINASCATAIATPTTTSVVAAVLNWGGSDPGTLAVTDSCGGRIDTTPSGTDALSGVWAPAASGGTCFVTVRAVNAAGAAAALSLAVLVRPGVAAEGPVVSAAFEDGCAFGPAESPTDCGTLRVIAPRSRNVTYNVSVRSGHFGPASYVDTCFPNTIVLPTPNGTTQRLAYSVSQAGMTCTATLHATTPEGGATDVVATYRTTNL